MLTAILGRILAAYLRFCFATGRWQAIGLDDLGAALKDGPVVKLFWHGRLMLAPLAWPTDLGPIAAPRDPSPAGRLSADTQKFLGTDPFELAARGGDKAVLKAAMQKVRAGSSLGLSADGPKGPALKVRRPPIDWTRATGRPVFLFAWSSRRALRLHTWDRLMIPLPFVGGTWIYRRWDGSVPRRLDQAGYRDVGRKLAAALNAVADEADRLAGRAPVPPKR